MFSRPARRLAFLQKLTKGWSLQPDLCPCDIHFVEWMRAHGLRDQTIFHFGTGSHHYVGVELCEGELNISVLGATATAAEHDTYIALVSDNPRLARNYAVRFGDIYLSNPAFLPVFDVVTLFHLAEFRSEARTDYGALSYAEVLDIFTERTTPGGSLLFYTGSCGWAEAEPVIAAWARRSPVKEAEGYKTLRVFTRV